MKTKNWVFPKNRNIEQIKSFAKELNVPEIIADVLIQRDITNLEQARLFLKPTLDDLYDPFLMKDMDKAVDRILQAMNNNEKIMIYGDYDVDGITATALLTLAFRELGVQVSHYLPDRMNEGYGLSETGVSEAIKRNSKLIITVDCGIRAHKEIELASKLGIDVIVTDHHQPGDFELKAVAVVNPKQEDDTYPFSELCGAGVAFKLLTAVLSKINKPFSIAEKYLDIASIGTIADIVPLVDENRIIAKFGLELINQRKRLGISSLIDVAGFSQKKIGSSEIVFGLAPRINAVGRLGHAERGIKLLLADSYRTAKSIAMMLNSENKRRQAIDEAILKEAVDMVEKNGNIKDKRTLVLASKNWHQGVIGIVASRMVEQYNRPTVMVSIDEESGMAKGSARSIPGFHLYNAISQCEEFLDGFGGHKYAAGLTLYQNQIEGFRKKFEEVASAILTDEDMIPKQEVVGEIRFRDISQKLIRLLNMFAPFGPKNMRPVLVSRNLQVDGTPYIVGKNHLKFKVKQDNIVLDAIAFNFGEEKLVDTLRYARPSIDIAYVLEKNTWRNKTILQARIKDIKINS